MYQNIIIFLAKSYSVICKSCILLKPSSFEMHVSYFQHLAQINTTEHQYVIG